MGAVARRSLRDKEDDGMEGQRAVGRRERAVGKTAASSFHPSSTSPQVAIDAPLAYVDYSK